MGILSKAQKASDYLDYASIVAGAVTGGAGLVAGGALGVAISQVVKGVTKKKEEEKK